MVKSIAQQVNQLLKKKPDIKNSDLYKKFPEVSKNTLRNYKSRFKKSLAKDSLRQRVFDFLKQNPKATNQTIYEEFSEFSKNKLRHYKASFLKTIEQPIEKSSKTSRSIVNKAKSLAGSRKSTKSDLEKRVSSLEKQVNQLTDAFEQISLQTALKPTVKKTEKFEKRIVELEEKLMTFIAEKRKKVGDELHLDELQQSIFNKLNSFISNIKNMK